MRPDVIADRYLVQGEIGRGAMGVVWLCQDQMLGRQVAVKQITAGDTNEPAARAEREARLAAALSHEHVVAVYDLVQHAGGRWLVMEYVQAENLRDIVTRRERLPAVEVAAICAQVASALAVAHRAGIVHRDVKPSNVLVGPNGTVKLADFGIARRMEDPHLTATGLVTGTPSYLAPEVARGQRPTPASDIWSLGATAFHALEGHGPFDDAENLSNPTSVVYRLATEQPPTAPHAGPLAPILAATLCRSVSDRWTAARLAKELTAVAEGRVAAVSEKVGRTVVAPAVVPTGQQRATKTLPPSPAPAAEPKPPAPQAPSPKPETSQQRDRATLGMFIVALAVFVGSALVAVLVWNNGRTDQAEAPPAQVTVTTTENITVSPSPSPSPATAPSAPSPPANSGADAMNTSVQDYFSNVTANREATWSRLSPGMQQRVGRDSYDRFWGGITSVSARNCRASTPSGSVTCDMTYVSRNGETSRERHRFDLITDGKGGYLIDRDTML